MIGLLVVSTSSAGYSAAEDSCTYCMCDKKRTCQQTGS
ncbi:hypothetical protein SeseC_00378 [Streptococcus equi subsp. zooepidemicus ATCC 35246]|nr:hypothetical protein SeseC_00378 [Streptococcus equi subsp. zooepidemicus ATCC 35246]